MQESISDKASDRVKRRINNGKYPKIVNTDATGSELKTIIKDDKHHKIEKKPIVLLSNVDI